MIKTETFIDNIDTIASFNRLCLKKICYTSPKIVPSIEYANTHSFFIKLKGQRVNMDTSAIYSKLASNKVLILPLISSLLLAGCNSNVGNQPTSFCELVDPNSKYYAPNTLTLDQLATCRLQAEKILAIQAMQIQIHRQRDAVISASNNQPTGGTEITKALNSLSSTDLETTPVATNRQTNSTSQTRQNPTNRSVQTNRIANANQNATKIIAQQTAVMPPQESIQQRYLNDASANPQTNNATRQSQSTQALQNAEQAARVARQIDDLLQSQAAQTVLNQPKALLPGEETTKTDIISQINSRNNVTNTTPAETTSASTATTTTNAAEVKQPVENPAVTNPAPTEKAAVIQENNNDTAVQNTANTSQDNAPPTSGTQLNAPTQSAGKLSTDYTSEPPAANAQTSTTSAESNPVAQIIKPIEARNNPVSTTQTKTQIDYYEPTPLPSLNDSNGLTPSAPNTAVKPDPLAHLQQKRTENK